MVLLRGADEGGAGVRESLAQRIGPSNNVIEPGEFAEGVSCGKVDRSN